MHKIEEIFDNVKKTLHEGIPEANVEFSRIFPQADGSGKRVYDLALNVYIRVDSDGNKVPIS
jgi:hypothetical protein